MVTFGEMTAIADEHFTDLQHQLRGKTINRDIRRRAVPPELARLAHVLARYHDKIADGFGVPRDTTGVRDAARRASTLLRDAERFLGPPNDTEIPRSALAQKLRAASIALGCGLDLLSTHFPVSSDDAPTATAAVIAASDTARSLFHQLSTHTATVAHLAYRSEPPADRAGGLLLRAALLMRIYGEQETRSPVNAIPLQSIPNRLPPRFGETFVEAFAGLDASIQRLSNPQTPTSVTTWRYLARAASITYDLNAKTLQQLIYRMKELEEPDHLAALKSAATAISKTGRKWREIVRRWDEQTNHYGHPANGPATDASDLIIRLGRLVHADPAWTPSPRASYRMKQPAELAPNLTQAAHVATLTLKVTEAYNTVAANHRAAINDAAVLGVLHQQREHPTHMPRVPNSVRQLSKSYKTAEDRGRHAITTLSQAIQALTPHPQAHAEEVHLIIRRTKITLKEQSQAHQANADFPAPIADLLKSPQVTSQPPSQAISKPTPSHKCSTP